MLFFLIRYITKKKISKYYLMNKKFNKKITNKLNFKENKCPNCMLENIELTISNEKFYDFFKELQIQCNYCDDKVPFNRVSSHKCFLLMKKNSTNLIENKEANQDEEEFKTINNIISVRCKKCKEFVEFTKKVNHRLVCPAIQQPKIEISLPLTRQCKYCYRNIQGMNISNEVDHFNLCPEYIKNISPMQPKTTNLIDNFNKFSINLDNSSVQLLAATINSLEKSILNFQIFHLQQLGAN